MIVGSESDLACWPSDGGAAKGPINGADAECVMISGALGFLSETASYAPDAARLLTSASTWSSGPRSSSPSEDGERVRGASLSLLGSGEPRDELGALGPVDVTELCDVQSECI